jgi:ABC-type antimicrobial peptide transport system permease subunit
MSALRLLLVSLAYHWRMHAAVACGVAAGTAVVTGALLVGDSMRGSLRQLTLQRLGRIDQALVADRFFPARLADELAARPGFPEHAAAIPALLLDVSVENAGGGDRAARANRVHLVGCDGRFWELGSGGPPQLPGTREVVLNQTLAEQLGVKAGDTVLVRLPHLGTIPADTPLGRKSETVRSQRLVVSEVIPASGLGRFSLSASQQAPRNAYVSLAWLQERLDQPGRVNAILAADAAESVQDLLAPRLEDYGIRVARTARGYVNVTSDRMLLEPAVERAVLLAGKGDRSNFAADPLIRREGASAAKLDLSPFPNPQPALTYLANTIACGNREIPYSTITAVDFAGRPPLGPMLSVDGKPVAGLADGQIALNRWAADDLQAKPGDAIRVSYFEPESTRGAVREQSATFRLAAVVELAGAAADADFTPEVPGVTDQLSIANWNPPFPFDARRVRKKDDAYWQTHRGTPKAFVSLAVGQKLWGSRFGQTTSLRIPATDAAAVERIDMGFVFRPVKAQGLAASAGTTPFEVLFLSFSFFLIVAAAMLVALLFRLGVERRATEIGILLAVGWRRRQVAGLLLGEGVAVAALGSLAGLAAGIGYAAMLIAGLHTLWLAAVVTPFLQLYVTWKALGIGYASGLIVATASIAWSAWHTGRGRPRRLLAGEVDTGSQRPGARHRRAARLAWVAIVGALILTVAATQASDEFQAAAFFGAASLVLAACLTGVWARLGSGATGPAVALGRGNLVRLAARNAARNPMRSTLTIGLVAAASFLIVAVSAFRIDPAKEKPNRTSGNGGFAIVAESDQPIYYDLNTAAGREQLGFSAEESQALSATLTIPLRVRPGDDASCLNLYRPQQPRVLGVPREFIARGGFAWASADENPWQRLEAELGPDEDGVPRVPVVLEKNTANYSLQLWKGVGETYDIRDGSGRPLRLVVVGLLTASLFQGDLLIRESDFLRHFPEQGGYRFFLIETKSDNASQVQNVERILERSLGDFGLWTQTTSQRLAAFQAVENTYLSTFQSLGGLGLLLGTFGLGAVQLRSVLERRRELALLRATGFRRRLLAGMVTLENAMLLAAGLACGVLSAAVAVLPHLWTGSASIPWASLAATLGLVLAVGLAAGWAAVRSAIRAPLLAALRGD